MRFNELKGLEGIDTLLECAPYVDEIFGDKKATCGDQNNPDLYGKQMAGKALCLPQTIGSTTGGMILFAACAHGKHPACMLFSKPIDSLAASGAMAEKLQLGK